jgi:hypothetical protein
MAGGESQSRAPNAAPSNRFSLIHLPLNLLEEPAQASAFGSVDHFDKTDAPLKVRSKRRMLLAILALRAKPHAVGQNRLQQVEIMTHYVHFFIHDKPRKILPPANSPK